jgi:hypothetical protein
VRFCRSSVVLELHFVVGGDRSAKRVFLGSLV